MLPRALILLTGLSVLGCSQRVQLDLFAAEPIPDAAPRERPDAGWLDVARPAGPVGDDGAVVLPRVGEDAGTDGPGEVSGSTSALRLRYDFSGQGSEVRDRVGGASAHVLGGATLDGSGSLALDGVDDYVDLPNGTLSSLESTTVVAWLSWGGGICWQRVFDFGHNDVGEDAQGNALASLFVTLATCPDGRLAGMAELPTRRFIAQAQAAVAPDRQLSVALSFDAARSLMTLYLDGVRVAESTASFSLSELADDNAWLGRSQWSQDYFARVRYDEFRIFDRALSGRAIADLYARGPDDP